MPVPLLICWGEKDVALEVSTLEGTDQYVRDVKIVRLPKASHWVQQDAPDEVNRALLGFLAKQPSYDDEEPRAPSGA